MPISSTILYKLAEGILNDQGFFTEEIDILSSEEKIKLLICLLRYGAQEDKENILLRRALFVARNLSGELPTLAELGISRVKYLDALNEEGVSYEELAINPQLTDQDMRPEYSATNTKLEFEK